MLAGSISLTGALVGCDDQIAQTAKARAVLDDAIVMIDEAEQGFVSGDTSGDYRAFRMDRLSQAETKLNAVIAQDADRLAKIGAHRLLAGVKSSQARAVTQQAEAGYRQINSRTSGLFNQLATAQRINALIVSRTGDGGAIVNALDEGQTLIQQSKAAVNASLAELSVQREAATLNAEKFHSQAASHFTRAGEFEDQSRVAPNGEVKQEVFTKAYSAQVDGQAAQRQAQEEEIQSQLAAQQIEALRTEIDLWDKMAEQITTLKQRVETEGADAARDVNTAGSDRGLALASVQEQVDQLSVIFNEQVQAPLATAAAKLSDGVAQLDKAIGLADAPDKKTLQFEQVGAKVELAGILSRHANYAVDFGEMLTAIIDHPVVAGGSAASSFQAKHAEFAQQAVTLKDQARGVIADGLTQSESMSGQDDIGQASQGLAQALRTYGEQLN